MMPNHPTTMATMPLPSFTEQKPWFEQFAALAAFVLKTLGCSVPNEGGLGGTGRRPAIYQVNSNEELPQLENYALLKTQSQFLRMRVRARNYFKEVATAFTNLCIPEQRERLAGAARILPSWYKTNPKLYEMAEKVQDVRQAEEPRIEAVVPTRRGPQGVGRTRKLVAREPCPAQYKLRNQGGRPRACTPLRARKAVAPA